jgi:hypothetical protein
MALLVAALLVSAVTERQQSRAEEPTPTASATATPTASPSPTTTTIRLEYVLPFPEKHEYVTELGQRVIAKSYAMFVAKVEKVFTARGAGEFVRVSVIERLYFPASEHRKQILLTSPSRGWYGKVGTEFVVAVSERAGTFDPIGRVPLPEKSRDAIIADLKGYLSIEASGEAAARRKALVLYLTDTIAGTAHTAVLATAAREFDRLTVGYATLFSGAEFDRIQPVLSGTSDKEAYAALKRGLEAVMRTGVATEMIREVQRAAIPGAKAVRLRVVADSLVRGFAEADVELLDRITPSIRDATAREDCEAALAAMRKSLGK